MRKAVFLLLFALFSATLVKAQSDTAYLNLHNDTLYTKTPREVKKPRSQQKKARPEGVELTRNIISLNVMDLMLKNISFSVEFIPGSGKSSIVMPLTFYSPLGAAIQNVNSSDLGKYNRSLATYIRAGFEWNYYPYGQRKYSYYTGLGLQSGYLKRDVDVQVDENGGVQQGLYFYFLVKNGVNINFGNHFCLGVQVHAGVNPDLEKIYFAMLGAVKVGVRF